jgi:hypothetical protein
MWPLRPAKQLAARKMLELQKIGQNWLEIGVKNSCNTVGYGL